MADYELIEFIAIMPRLIDKFIVSSASVKASVQTLLANAKNLGYFYTEMF